MLFSARIFFAFLIAIVILISPSKILAQTNLLNPSTSPNVPQNLHTFTQSAMIEVLSSISCILVGSDPIRPSEKCLGIDPKTKKIGYVENNGGLLSIMVGGLSLLYTSPIHTGDYVKYLAGNFGVSKAAYAQGAGFTSITPFIGIWTTFRNVVYMLFVIVFVLIGVGIMFRLKIDQRTVMAIENQIPKIIIGILLVTFSFAIAGFLIDLMYAIMYLAIAIISPRDLATLDYTGNAFSFANSLFQNPNDPVTTNQGLMTIILRPAQSVAAVITNMMNNAMGNSGAGITTIVGSAAATAIFLPAFWALTLPIPIIFGINSILCAFNHGVTCGQVDASHVFGIVGGAFAFLVIAVAVFWALFRLMFALLNAYVFILLGIVLAPFWILAGLLPGSTWGFSAWMRDMIANLSTFPVAIIMFLLGKRFMEELGNVPGNSPQFTPPLIGAPAVPSILANFIGLGVILMTPAVVEMMRKALNAPQFPYTAMIGKAIGTGLGVPGRVAGGTWNTAFGPQIGTQGQLIYKQGNLDRFLRGFGLIR